jgi:hypothetical protein
MNMNRFRHDRSYSLLARVLAAALSLYSLSACAGGSTSVPSVAGTVLPTSSLNAFPSSAAATKGYAGHDPVILIPGMTSPASEMEPMKLEFENAGWPANIVFTWTDSTDMEGDLATAAGELQNEVRAVLAQTGARHVVLVTWSAAALAGRYYIKNLDRRTVSIYVGMAGPQHGTTFNACQAYASCQEFMAPNTPFLTALNRGTEVPGSPRVNYMTVRSDNDINVAPEASAMLAGANLNFELTGLTAPSHFQYPEDSATFAAVEKFILEVEEGRAPKPGSPAP